MNKALIITYYFPPSGGAGVQRTLKFVKYLRSFGWEPIILTARNADYPAYDESLLNELPSDLLVYRSRIIEPYKLYRKITGKSNDSSADIATLSLSNSQKQKLSERVSEWIRSAFFVPDARMLWYFFAVKCAKKIIKKNNINLIYSSAPPYTTHLIANKLHKTTGLPWVADFRDSWIGWLSTPQKRPKLSSYFEYRMEESVLKNASKILTVSNGVKKDLLGRHPHLNDSRWTLLTNGFDSMDFKNLLPKHKSNRLTITYTGSMYGNRNPEYLLLALEKLATSVPNLSEKILVRIVGRVGESIQQRINSSSVASIFEIVEYVPHSQSLEYLLSTDVALLIIDDAPANKGILTGKLFEYIGSGKPVLALAPEGDASELLKSENVGTVISPTDVQAIQNYLTALLENAPEHKKAKDAFLKYDRKNLTKNLAEIFNHLIK
jgi:glycosyltransferase involved in cell wall biosynthesis